MLNVSRSQIRLSGSFQEIISPDSRDVLYIDNMTGYWFGIKIIFQPFIRTLQKGVPQDEVGYSVPGWEHILNRLERDGQFDESACKELSGLPRVGLIIIEPSQYCNLSCHYCFEDIPTRGCSMTRKTADKIIEKITTLNLAENIVVEFSGGEPFLNFPILKYLVDRIANINFPRGSAKDVTFTVQSNGTVMTHEIAEFLRTRDMTIGISLDGPANVHDRNRIFASGKGSWDVIMRNLDILREHNVGFGFLSVIDSPENVESVYDFLINQGPLTIRMNLRRVNGRSKVHISDEMLTQIAEEDYAISRRSLESYRSGLPTPRLANLCYMIENIVMPTPAFMCQRSPCGAGIDQIVFDYAGNCWPCQEFVGDNRFQIATIDVADIPRSAVNHQTLISMRNRRLGDSEECRNCCWNHFCQGGCFATTYYAADGNLAKALRAKTPHCAYYKYMFSKLIWDVYYEPETLLGYIV